MRTEALISLLEALRERGIRAAPIKGPLLAHLYYGSIELRPFTDVDILVEPEDVPAAVRTLVGLGGIVSGEAFESGPRSLHAVTVVGPGELLTEIHAALGPRFFRLPLPIFEVLGRATPVPFGRGSVLALDPADLLLFLCHHGARHEWARLIWISDVARIAHERPDVVARTLARAEAVGCRRLVLLGLALGRRLGAELDGAVVREADHEPAIARLMHRVDQLLRVPGPVGILSKYAFRFDARERLRDRLRDGLLLTAFVTEPMVDSARAFVSRR